MTLWDDSLCKKRQDLGNRKHLLGILSTWLRLHEVVQQFFAVQVLVLEIAQPTAHTHSKNNGSSPISMTCDMSKKRLVLCTFFCFR